MNESQKAAIEFYRRANQLLFVLAGGLTVSLIAFLASVWNEPGAVRVVVWWCIETFGLASLAFVVGLTHPEFTSIAFRRLLSMFGALLVVGGMYFATANFGTLINGRISWSDQWLVLDQVREEIMDGEQFATGSPPPYL